ncbi:MAG TPA: Mrp/NBP35 family ATP-binding protein [Dehalococcoidia bacterium]|nr:Mrp/NBP35 family ATP-binding protein [Dehalococcoidia bacterium]
MTTEEHIRERLEDVLVPGSMRSLVKLNLVRNISVADGKMDISLASTALSSKAQGWLKTKVTDTVKALPGIKSATVDFTEARPKELNEVKHVVAIMSGKGGVGKSLVTSLIGISLARRGYEVGILDADITGPSIPRMFGISERPAGSETGMLPPLSHLGIEIMSINLILLNEDDAVIWRGPLIGKTITQFWEDVLWGKLDYLLVDLPPGTADAPLTVMQTLPLSGVVIVFSPQELAAMVVRKAVRMAKQMSVPIIGVVENMSYFTIPDSGKKIELFGKSKGQEMAKAAGAPLLGQLPIEPELALLCDEGHIERYDSEILNNLADAFLKAMSDKANE